MPPPVDYTKPASWLCLPGRADTCSTPLRTTALNPNGYGSTGRSTVARNPKIDCFIVYPTVSRDQGLNSDLNPGDGEEKDSIATQFARLSGVCRTFAPIYRSMTLGAVTAAATGGDVTIPAAIAFGDVRAAWRNYLATRNQGRPFVLVGHSQGSLMLQQLLARDIEGRPEAKRMKLAIIPGFNVMVPQGKRVGGTFKSTPLCATANETGCVMSWVSFRERNTPPAGAIFGIASAPGMTVGCTNPARPGATGWVPARQLLVQPLDLSRRRRPDRLVVRRPAPDAISCAPKASSRRAASATARAAICRSAPTPTPATSAPTASAAKSARSASSSPAGACTLPTSTQPGRYHPRDRAGIRASEQFPDRLAKRARQLSASKAEGTNTPFSTVLTVLRVTRTASASSACVSPSSPRFSFNRLASDLGIAQRARSSMPKRSIAAAIPNETMMWIASRVAIGSYIDRKNRPIALNIAITNPQPIAEARWARVPVVDHVAHVARTEPEPLRRQRRQQHQDSTTDALILTWSTVRSPSQR